MPSRRPVLTYLFFLLLFSCVFYFLIIHAKRVGAGAGLYVFGIMWCPALAACTTLKLHGRSLAELGWTWPATKYALMSWYVPLIYAAIAYAVVWSSGLGGFPNHEFMSSLVERMGERLSPVASTALYIVLTGSFGVIRSLSSGLGEEIGWRGFLVPELSKNFGFTATALISGVIWSLWHYPALIFADYNAGTATWYALTCFTVMVIAISFVFAWLRLKSGSLWTAALLHASHNLYVQAIFTPLTRDTGKTAWYIDEFGAVLPLVAVAFAVYFWTRRGELPLTALHNRPPESV
ncbi:MAG TPA: type II CAAX endopeptidase family protein [Candidatus Sulfotelmatobacter sp.]|nr:type II CAAX endopeptidase family protein [Candidatus Sulfotelmatobacter sp.]